MTSSRPTPDDSDYAVEGPFLTEQQLADRWQVRAGSLANARSDGRSLVPHIKLMSRVRYPLRAIREYEATLIEQAA